MTHRAAPAFERVDVEAVLADLRDRTVNYGSGDLAAPDWNVDTHRVWLTPENPGAPHPHGCWHTACRLIADYDFCPPEILRAAYDPAQQLLGRTMLLEGRISALRLYVPVRITAVIDEHRPPDQRVWGFSYDTLYGHLERGRLTYEVIKHQHSGHVEFAITAHSQPAPTLGAVLRLGWTLFGRRRQVLFYRRCGHRMQQLTHPATPPPPQPAAHEHLRFAPADATRNWLDPIALHNIDPG